MRIDIWKEKKKRTIRREGERSEGRQEKGEER